MQKTAHVAKILNQSSWANLTLEHLISLVPKLSSHMYRSALQPPRSIYRSLQCKAFRGTLVILVSIDKKMFSKVRCLAYAKVGGAVQSAKKKVSLGPCIPYSHGDEIWNAPNFRDCSHERKEKEKTHHDQEFSPHCDCWWFIHISVLT